MLFLHTQNAAGPLSVKSVYFVEKGAVISGGGGVSALGAGLSFRPTYRAAFWSVALPVQMILRSLFRQSRVLVLQDFEGSARLLRA